MSSVLLVYDATASYAERLDFAYCALLDFLVERGFHLDRSDIKRIERDDRTALSWRTPESPRKEYEFSLLRESEPSS